MTKTQSALPPRTTCLVVLLLALPGTLSAAAASPARHPNVIFILSDDLGYADISPYGQRQIKTPHLERLAREGMRFTHAYSGSPLCGPSRAALFLGLHNGHNPIRHNPGAARGWDRTTQGDPPLPENIPTFANVLKQAGYATACFGKWGMGVPGAAGSPDRLGFETFLGYASHVDAHTYWPNHLWRNNRKVPLDGKTYTHDLFTEEALSYIRANRAGPFFIFLSFTIPHVGLDPPSLAPYDNEPWPEKEKAFAAMVTRMDRDVGRIGSLLKELGIDDDTLMLFASDNGPCTAGGHKASTFASTLFRAEKSWPYEGGIRIPFLARWPKRIQSGRESDLPVAFYRLLHAEGEAARRLDDAKCLAVAPAAPLCVSRGGLCHVASSRGHRVGYQRHHHTRTSR